MALGHWETQLAGELSNCTRRTANTNEYALEWPSEDQVTYLIGSGPQELIGSVNAEECQMDLEFSAHLVSNDVTPDAEFNQLPENKYNLTFSISDDSLRGSSV